MVVVVSVRGNRSCRIQCTVGVIALNRIGRIERNRQNPLQDRYTIVADPRDDAVQLGVLPVLAILVLVIIPVTPAAFVAGGVDTTVGAVVIIVIAPIAVALIGIPTVLAGLIRVRLPAMSLISMPVAIG